MAFGGLLKTLRELDRGHLIDAMSICVASGGEIVFSEAFGEIEEAGVPVTRSSAFDIASLTKILSGICFAQMVDEGLFSFDDPIASAFPEMTGEKAVEVDGRLVGRIEGDLVTWRHVLSHTSGIAWNGPLSDLESGIGAICSSHFSHEPGTRVVYGNAPFILMGRAMEVSSGQTLDDILKARLTAPLGLAHTGFRRCSSSGADDLDRIVPTEYDGDLRKRRIWGEVHDEKAWVLDGVSGNAGVFSTAEDVALIMMAFARSLEEGGILCRSTAREMVSVQANVDGSRRGLAWQLSGDVDAGYARKLSRGSYGHTGFTGCFAWNDPERDLTIVFLSNDVYKGRDRRILPAWRERIVEGALDGLGDFRLPC